jgi:hypothetical protein
MIRLSDDALAEFFSRYVTGALDLYLQAKRGVQSLASYNPLAQLPLAATDALARMWMASPFGGPYQPQYPNAFVAPAPVPAPEDGEPAPRKRGGTEPGVTDNARGDDVAAMRRELDELKQALRDGLGKRSRKRRT